MSLFELRQELDSVTGGAQRYDLEQMYPQSGNVTGAYVGSGAASGLTTFQWADSVRWWCPEMSYFRIQCKIGKMSGGSLGAIPATDYIAYADNFVSTFFSQIKTQINSRQLDIITQPYIIDTALTYANCKEGSLRSWQSMSYVGEGLMTRWDNTSVSTSVAGNLEVIFRPPISLFGVRILPPGAQFRVDFNWAANALYAFESFGQTLLNSLIGTANNDYNIMINDFSFFKATVDPSALVALPEQGVIDLNPTIVNQYYLNGGSSLRQNITLPSTTNRILVTVQDMNSSTTAVTSVGLGVIPPTSFAYAVSDLATNTSYGSPLATFYLTLPELGQTLPSPQYNFDKATLADWKRAYADFCNVVQGSADGCEGSVPFGTYDIAQGITINALATDTASSSVFQAGNPNNLQQFFWSGKAAAASMPAATFANQTARFGWAGRCPGPIFAFPVVRPENKDISTGTLNATFTSAVASAVFNVICTYSMALELLHEGNGLYSYRLVEGV